MKHNCPECTKPCPEHGILECATCHKHVGECSYGSCQENSDRYQRFDFNGQEVREFCTFHGTSARYAFVRAGGKRI